MIEISSWTLKNVVHIEKATIKVLPGLFVIRGLNLASNGKNQNNGAGKSLICSAIPNIVLGTPPILSKKKVKADLLSKKSQLTLKFKTHYGKEVVIHQQQRDYAISEDGKSLDIATVSKAEDQIRKYFPLNEAEFYSTVYLTSHPHPFQISSPTERLKFITNIFCLNDYEVLRKHYATRLRSIKDSETEYRTLLSEYIQHEQSINKIDWSKQNENSLKKKQEELKSLNTGLVELQSQLLEFSKIAHKAKQYRDLKKKLESFDTKYTKNSLVELEVLYSQCQDYNQYVLNLKSFRESYAKQQERIDSITVEETYTECLSEHEKYTKLYKNLQDALNRLDSVRLEYTKSKSDRNRLKKVYEAYNFDASNVDIADISEQIYECKSVLKLEHLLGTECETVECPMCMSQFDYANLQSMVTKASKKYSKLKNISDAYKAYVEYSAITIPDFDEERYYTDSKKCKKYNQMLEYCDDQLAKHSKLQTLKEALGSLVEPKKVKKPDINIEEVMEKLEECKEYLRLSLDLVEYESESESLSKFKQSKYSELKQRYDDTSARISNLHENCRRLESSKAQFDLLSANRDSLKQKLESLSALVSEKKIVSTLVSAYGPKGIKVNVIASLCKDLESYFNAFSPLLFNEDFEFEVLADASGISVLAHRGDKVADIKTLSGAESDCFRLLFLIAMLHLLPDDKKCNILVLDECSSHMDTISKQKFISDFIPYINSIVPTVYVLDPHNDPYVDSVNYVVIKENGVGKLSLDDRLF